MSTPTGQGTRGGPAPGRAALDEPTIGRLVADTSRHLSSLIRAEIALAKAELKISVTAGGIGLALVAVAAFLAVLAIIMVSFAAAYFLAKIPYLDVACGFLIVFGFYLLLAAAAGAAGDCAGSRRSRRRRRRSRRPRTPSPRCGTADRPVRCSRRSTPVAAASRPCSALPATWSAVST